MSMKYKLVVSELADQQIVSHAVFIGEKSQDAAYKVLESLQDAIASLGIMPERCPFFNEQYILLNKYHKLLVAQYYLILFQIRDGTVYVDYVMDCRQNYGFLLK